MAELYESKYFASTEPLERADRKGYDFDSWEISDLLRALDKELEEILVVAQQKAFERAVRGAYTACEHMTKQERDQLLANNPYSKEQTQ